MGRILLTSASAIAASLLLSGWFFFFIPLSLFGNDKKTVDELLQKQDWTGLLRLSEERIGKPPESCYLPQCDPMRPPGKGRFEDQPAWHFLRAQSLHNLGRCADATESYRSAVAARQGSYPEASNGLGHCLLQIGKPEEAESAFRAAIRSKPEMWQPYAGMIDVAIAQSKQSDAMAALDSLRVRNMEVARDYSSKIAVKFAQPQAVTSQQVAAPPAVPAAVPKEPQPAPQPQTASPKSLEDRLRELKSLYEKGLITKEVYDQSQRDALQGK
jgi:tetratricopeptide (TPR) repeat protein